MSNALLPHKTEHLRSLLEAFAVKAPSLQLAKELEGLIAKKFPREHPLQELAEMLAQYCPGGGDYLYSEAEIRPYAAAWLKLIAESSP